MKRVSLVISSIFMLIILGLYVIVLYIPVIFKALYNMPNYYLFSFFPPIIHWLLLETVIMAGIVIWRSAVKRDKKAKSRN